MPTPTPGPAIVRDDFERAVTNGLGIANPGGAYAITGTAADYGVTGGMGSVRTPAGSIRNALLGTASAADVSVGLSLRPSVLPQSGSIWLYAVVRRQSSGSEYRVKVRIDPDGSVYTGLSRVSGTTELNLTGETIVPGLIAAPREAIQLRGEVSGVNPTLLRVRAWTGSPEPSGWQISLTDATSDLQAAGTVGLRIYLGKTVTDGPITFMLDDYLVAAPGPVAPPPPPPDPNAIVIAGAGDIAGCPPVGSLQTAALLQAINAQRVFTVGDNAYPDGAAADFACFDQAWGPFKSAMIPVPGNHEYNTPGATPYFDYFGSLAGPAGLGYYATDVGSWRIYALDSECAFVDCTAELAWLVNDLAANPRQCTIGIWHEPRFSSGMHGDSSWVVPFYQALYDADAELVLSGHDHDYERFEPMDPSGNLDVATGIREFIVGTGGIGSYALSSIHANSAIRQTGTYGVLQLTLHAASYDWQFIPVAGKTFTDSGSGTCH